MMNKYTRLLIIVFMISIICLGAISPVHADNNINIVDDSLDVHFPGAIVFKIQANSTSDINDIRLHYVVKRVNYTKVISEAWPIFLPSTNVDTQWTWDMRYSLLPPGTEIDYWWSLENKNGNSVTTGQKTIFFNDNTHSWKKISSKNITIYWYDGDNDFADKLITAAVEALNKLENDTGVKLEQQAEIYVYSSADDLHKSMIFPDEWTGGVAYSEFGKIIITISPSNVQNDIVGLAHELGHLVVHQIVFSSYGSLLPFWLDEGLAVHAQPAMDSYYPVILKYSLDKNLLISIRSLCSSFSAIPEQAYLSYAESQSIVGYLINEFGRDKILSLLIKFKQGTTCDDALQQVYGFNMQKLESRWIDWLKASYEKQSPVAMEEIKPEQETALILPDFVYLSFNRITVFQS
jgi:hypothetical protein